MILKAVYLLFTVCLLVISPALTEAQRRGRRAPTPRRSTTTTASSDAIALGRMKVAERIKILSEFLYVYGGIVNEIEQTETQARAGDAGPELTSLANRSKGVLRRSLQDVRAGLDQLEQEFRTSPDLQRYYNRLAGVSLAAADAEEMAASNQLKPAGRKLLSVVNQLADALAAMN